MDYESLIQKTEQKLKDKFDRIDKIALYNQEKVLNSFFKNKVNYSHFNPTTGYAWSFDAPYDEKVLILSSDTFTNPEAEGVTGAPGRRILTFSVVGPGRSGIRLGYKRPWERNSRPDRVFQLLVFATGEPPAPLWEEEKTSTPRIGSKGQVVPERKGVFD